MHLTSNVCIQQHYYRANYVVSWCFINYLDLLFVLIYLIWLIYIFFVNIIILYFTMYYQHTLLIYLFVLLIYCIYYIRNLLQIVVLLLLRCFPSTVSGSPVLLLAFNVNSNFMLIIVILLWLMEPVFLLIVTGSGPFSPTRTMNVFLWFI